MKFIKKIILNNFQSHKNSVLEFDPNLNVIVGPSDSGKSSVIRGIKWVLFNEPVGDFFIREGETETSVELYFSDGSKITRHRSNSKNAYILNYPDGEELVLTGFGVKVPVEVQELTGIKKIPFDINSSEIINISDQLEGPFLLSEKNSTKAFVIGSLAGVDIVDDSIRDLLKEIRNLSINKNNVDDDLKLIEEELKEFDNLEEQKSIYEKLKNIYEKIEKKELLLSNLEKILLKINQINVEKNNSNIILGKLKKIEETKIIYMDLFEDTSKYNYYNNLLNRYSNINNNIKITKKIVDNYKNLDKVYLLNNELLNNIKDYSNLNLYNNKNKLLKENIIKIKNNLENFMKLNELLDRYSILSKLYNSYNSLIIYNMQYKDIEKRQAIGKEYIKNFKNINLIYENNQRISKILTEFKNLEIIYKNKKINEKEIDLVKNKIKDYNDDISHLSKEYGTILLDSKICPTCFSDIDATKIDNIIKNLSK